MEDGEAAPAEAADVQQSQRSPAAQDPQRSEDAGNEHHAGAQQEEELPGLPSGVQEVELDHMEIEQKGSEQLVRLLGKCHGLLERITLSRMTNLARWDAPATSELSAGAPRSRNGT
eukprot:Mycagemm_TRINITY_DN10266_c0_g1::TRINITY_DN10266_c0_g1_i2::g.3827::m.3827 type:complete len:116 gc:universal TRINITY_DN10266_c0_g1_i2:558-905(+)